MTIQIKNFKIILLAIVSTLAFTFTSCSTDDDPLSIENFTTDIENRSEAGKKGSCFEFVYPVSYIIGGEEVSFDSGEALKEAKRAYKEEAGEGAERPTIVLPVTITNSEGEEVEIASQEELADIKEACRGMRKGNGKRGKGHKCFSLVYPITVSIGGVESSFESREALKEAKKAYIMEAGADAVEISLVYPITIEYADGTQADVASEEDLQVIKEECDNS